jgi:hypothetical protein
MTDSSSSLADQPKRRSTCAVGAAATAVSQRGCHLRRSGRSTAGPGYDALELDGSTGRGLPRTYDIAVSGDGDRRTMPAASAA